MRWVVENPTSMHAAVNIRPSLKIESQDLEQRLSSDLYTCAVACATHMLICLHTYKHELLLRRHTEVHADQLDQSQSLFHEKEPILLKQICPYLDDRFMGIYYANLFTIIGFEYSILPLKKTNIINVQKCKVVKIQRT